MSTTWAPAAGPAMPQAGIPDFSVRVNGANLPQEARADIRAVTGMDQAPGQPRRWAAR